MPDRSSSTPAADDFIDALRNALVGAITAKRPDGSDLADDDSALAYIDEELARARSALVRREEPEGADEPPERQKKTASVTITKDMVGAEMAGLAEAYAARRKCSVPAAHDWLAGNDRQYQDLYALYCAAPAEPVPAMAKHEASSTFAEWALDQLAKELLAKGGHKPLTYAQAYDLALRQRPDLYATSLAQRADGLA